MPRGGLLRSPAALALALAASALGAGAADGGLRAAVEHLRQHGVTDHPRHAAAERAAAELRGPEAESPLVGQLREGAPPPEAPGQVHAESAPSAPPLVANGQRPKWRLTVEGVPCHLPFSFEGVSYSDCHPAGWCCVDPLCARRGTCAQPRRNSSSSSGGAGGAWQPLFLIHPRDEPQTACSLPTVGDTAFEWSPSREAAGDGTTVFLLLSADAGEPWEEDVAPLLELAQEPVKFVWLSYSTNESKVERLMLHMQSRLKQAIRNTTASASRSGQLQRVSGQGRHADAAQGHFFFVRTPAWHISLQSCWLPSVLHAWSRMSPVLTVELQGSHSPESVLVRTAASGVKGNWAPSWEAGTAKGVAGALRWFGLACGEKEEAGPLPVSDVRGKVALVQRGRCSFYRKVRSAQDAGASAVVVFSNDDSPIRMGCAGPDPCNEALAISAVMVDRSTGQALLDALNASSQGLLAQITGERRGPAHVGLRGGGGGIHAFGRLQAGLRSVAREALGLETERRQAARRSEMKAQAAAGDGVAVVEVFERQHLAGSLVAPWSAARAAALRDQQYDSLELELRLDCKDHLDSNCGPWDFEIDLYLCGSAKPDCRDRAANLGRWITPYGREARWISNATAALPLLLGAGANSTQHGGHLHMRSNWWQAYTVSLALWFRRAAPAAARGPALAHVPLWRGGRFNESYNVEQKPRTFDVPADTSRAILSVLLSGHGWGIEEANCAEFCNHSHHFRVNGQAQIVKAFPEAGTGDACGASVARGVVPNQFGTWTFGRAGWCPGLPVTWWEADVTSLLLHGDAPNNITYQALFNGTGYVPVPAKNANSNGYAAEIHLASFLTFYGSAAAPPGGAAAEASAPAGRRRPLLLL